MFVQVAGGLSHAPAMRSSRSAGLLLFSASVTVVGCFVVLLFCWFVGLLVLVGWFVGWLPPCCWNSGVDEADGATEQRMAGQELFSRKRLNATRRADVEGVVFEAQGNLEQSLMMSRTMSAG